MEQPFLAEFVTLSGQVGAEAKPEDATRVILFYYRILEFCLYLYIYIGIYIYIYLYIYTNTNITNE